MKLTAQQIEAVRRDADRESRLFVAACSGIAGEYMKIAAQVAEERAIERADPACGKRVQP